MATKIKLFVYGHYDSRGGTTGVDAPTREEADRIYESVFCWNSAEDIKFRQDNWDANLPNGGWSSPAKEDFIATADLEIPDNAPGIEPEGHELDGTEIDGKMWFVFIRGIAENGDSPFDVNMTKTQQEAALKATIDRWDRDKTNEMSLEQLREYHDKQAAERGPEPTPHWELLWAPAEFNSETGEVRKSPKGFFHPRWDDDAYNFILMSKEV